jgi:hypothetical protein
MTAFQMVEDSPYIFFGLSWLVDHLARNGTANQRMVELERPSEVTLSRDFLLLVGSIELRSGA